jgi:hypothetical protein
MGGSEEKKSWVERNSGVIVAVLGVIAGLIGLATAMANRKDAPRASQQPAGAAAPVDVSRPTQPEAQLPQLQQSAPSRPVTQPATSQAVPQSAPARQAPAGRCSLPGTWEMVEFMPGARPGSSGIPYAMSFTGEAIALEIDSMLPQFRPLKIPCTVEADGIVLGRNPDPNIATMTQLLFPPRYEKQPDGTYKGEINGSTYYLVRTE